MSKLTDPMPGGRWSKAQATLAELDVRDLMPPAIVQWLWEMASDAQINQAVKPYIPKRW